MGPTEEEATARWRRLQRKRVGWGLWRLISGIALVAVGVGSFAIPMLRPPYLPNVVWSGAIILGCIQLLRGIVELLRAACRSQPSEW